MDQQVSPAVVVIVLILIVAILVGLYFLIVERDEPVGEDATGEVVPSAGDPVPLDPTPPAAGEGLDQEEAGAEPDTAANAEADPDAEGGEAGQAEDADASSDAEPAAEDGAASGSA